MSHLVEKFARLGSISVNFHALSFASDLFWSIKIDMGFFLFLPTLSEQKHGHNSTLKTFFSFISPK